MSLSKKNRRPRLHQKRKQAWMIHWHPLRPSVSPKLKKADHAGVSGADLVAIETTTETKVHHGAGHHENVKDRTRIVIAAVETLKSHRLAIAMRDPPKDRKIEEGEADAATRLRSDLTRAANLPDEASEAVAVLASG